MGIHEILPPVYSHIDREAAHCERRAFLHVTRAAVRRCGRDAADECSGVVSMYVPHFPCVSCLAVSCQFIRFFPAVRVEMDFDDMWKTWLQGRCLNWRHNAWEVFDVQEAKVDPNY